MYYKENKVPNRTLLLFYITKNEKKKIQRRAFVLQQGFHAFLIELLSFHRHLHHVKKPAWRKDDNNIYIPHNM